ncbi:hypothetical protein [Heyndrickxia vini]|uniref:Chemotaxis protein CheX n=1 Tax=Heyndrickxia vini TaxID=1476025 RepID=A0ABX7E0C4_9BACI|nr:hypothetical protein [Heyndrickxia vini]QQZ08972.1 hypothetical protein I5776_18560 [Heyndrickxia vini]
MFSQYFGHYLLNRGLITKEQLTDALELQKSVHVKFGVMAVDEGFMTPLQVGVVHEKQKQLDKRFGEIAVDLGYLTNEQVELLVSNQKQKHLFLAQALVDREYMTIEQFGKALNDYKNENSLSDEQFEAVKNGSIETLVENILVNDSEKEAVFGRYLSLFMKNMIRFIDDQVYIEVAEKEVIVGDWLVHQEILGEVPFFTAINADEKAFLHIASKHAEEELHEVDEMARASVSEFLNLHNGIYLVNMSNWGVELEMKPQQINGRATVSGDIFVVNIHTTKGSFQLILSNQPENITIEQPIESLQTL